MSTNNKLNLPQDGIAGLKENFSTDAISGFIVFLLALPLSLGIAKASDFPPLMGLLSHYWRYACEYFFGFAPND